MRRQILLIPKEVKVIRRMGIIPKMEVETIQQILITPQPIILKIKQMEQVALLKEVQPLLEQMKQVQIDKKSYSVFSV